MDELARKTVEAERDGVVRLLRTVADRLASLAASEVREPLARLAAPVTTLAHEAEPLLGPLPPPPHRATADGARPWPTVVFVHRGCGLGA